ncbi:hypothetical protein [Paenibacillus sp.]|uniref:hypothetical protein n=1 Tax=Paenibacillus sp. TaxID=58172 RepID=UPI00282F74CC|nr:hypothetical protein [Paenibacillus sp.]MDR0268151.1 hypothetical protein [Paenibacillus sp.]
MKKGRESECEVEDVYLLIQLLSHFARKLGQQAPVQNRRLFIRSFFGMTGERLIGQMMVC